MSIIQREISIRLLSWLYIVIVGFSVLTKYLYSKFFATKEVVEPQIDVIQDPIEPEVVQHDIIVDTFHNEVPIEISESKPQDIKDDKFRHTFDVLKGEISYNKDRNPELYEKKLIEWLALDPANHDFMLQLAEYYFDTSQRKKSLTLYKKLLDENNALDHALWKSAIISLELVDTPTALYLIEKAISYKQENPKYLMTKAEILYQKKWEHTQDIVELLIKVIKLRPSNTDYMQTLAKVYLETNQDTQYFKMVRMILDIDPAHERARQQMKRNG